MRNKRIEKILRDIKKNPPKPREPMSLEMQLGLYIGEHIADQKLPVLSIDYDTPRSVKVSEEDTKRYEDVQKILYDRFNNSSIDSKSDEWLNYIALRKELKRKYIPETLVCFVQKIESVSNWEDLKKGIGSALWDSDISHYSCNVSDIVIEDDDNVLRYSKIILKRADD